MVPTHLEPGEGALVGRVGTFGPILCNLGSRSPSHACEASERRLFWVGAMGFVSPQIHRTKL